MTRQIIDAAYINSLVKLVTACRAHNVAIDTVSLFDNGFHVTFVGFPHADAICHDFSYGSPCRFGEHRNDWGTSGAWETIGFPWDNEDVSVHTAEELASFIEALKNGKTPWESEW